MQPTNTFGTSQTFGARAKRSLLSIPSSLSLAYSGVTGQRPDPIDLKIVQDNDILNDEYRQSLQSPTRQKDYNSLLRDYNNAEGIVDNVKQSARLIADTVVHPSELNVAGGLAQAGDPTNYLGGGGRVLKQLAVNTAVNASKSYGVGKALGLTEEQSQRRAVTGGLNSLVNLPISRNARQGQFPTIRNGRVIRDPRSSRVTAPPAIDDGREN